MSTLIDGLKAFASSLFYEASQSSRTRTNVPYVATDSRKELTRYTRTIMLSKARWLYANDGLTRGAINDMARYSIGSGLTPQAISKNEKWNAAAEKYWARWCKAADVTGKLHFNRMQRILSVAMDRDGDVGLILRPSSTGFPQIQMVEGHRIGNGTGESDGFVDGVRVNDAGRPTHYRIVSVDTDGTETATDIPANNFVMLFDPERSDQVRGVTALYHAINTLHDKKDIADFIKIGVKNDASIALKMKTATGEIDPAQWDEDEVTVDGKKMSVATVHGGQIMAIASDEDVEPFNSDRPSQNVREFLDFLIRDVSLGLGLPFEFIWNPEKLGGTAQRFILEKAQRRFRERQDLFVSMLLDRLWFWVISVGIKRGELDSMPVEDRLLVKWQTPSELSVDAGRDADSDREDVKMGLMNEAEHFGRRGKDWKDERAQRGREIDDLLVRAKELVTAHGITLEMALTLLQQTTPNGFQPAKPDEPKPGKPTDKKEEKK